MVAKRSRHAELLVCAATLFFGACETQQPEPPKITFGNAAAIGKWAPEAVQPEAPGETSPNGDEPAPAGSSGQPVSPATTAGQGPAAGGAVMGIAGMTASMSAGGNGSVASAGSGAAGARAAGSGGAAGTGGVKGTAGSGGMGGSMAGTGAEMPANGMLRFTVLTKTLNGRYSPKNIGAIWIERASGEFVKTLELWAATRVRWLARWRAESGSNKVDAVTSATLRSHMTHTASWNLTDANRSAVAPGDYKVVVEMTDHDGNGDSTEVPFTVGDPVMLTPSDQTHFVNMTLTLE